MVQDQLIQRDIPETLRRSCVLEMIVPDDPKMNDLSEVLLRTYYAYKQCDARHQALVNWLDGNTQLLDQLNQELLEYSIPDPLHRL